MTLEEAAANIGRAVICRHGPKCPEECIEYGVITAATSRYVFVRYGTDQHSKATDAERLDFAGDT